jgi:hypothetical protein
MELAPIVLFTYNRIYQTRNTLEALQKNFLARESELFIFSDGPKDYTSKKQVNLVREYLKSVTGFKNISIIEQAKNKGLANSIIDGVSEILEKYEKVIVLEDDLLTSKNFLTFMNSALNFYQQNNLIFTISGWSLDLKTLTNHDKDYYLHLRTSSWGWATWRNRWELIDWKLDDYKKYSRSLKQKYKFAKIGSDLPGMLKGYMTGNNNSWAIRACFHQFKYGYLTVAPSKSKITNIGFTPDATHTFGKNNYDGVLDNSHQTNFQFSNDLSLDKTILKEYRSYFSLFQRIFRKFFRK